jgi:hypothetical protein
MDETPFPESEILLAVIRGDEEHAIEIIKTMTPRERLLLRHHGHQMTALITAIRRELGEE